MSFIVLGLGADPRIYTGLNEDSSASSLRAEEPILTHKSQSSGDFDPFAFFEFLELLDVLALFF